MNSHLESAQGSDPVTPATARKSPSITTHYLRYSAANMVVMLAGLISFPIITRLLDNAEFGVLRYYEALMLFGVALIKLGSSHAIIRIYPYGGGPREIRAFGTNLVLLPLMLTGMLWALGFVALGLWALWTGATLHPVLWCAVLIMPLLAVGAVVQAVMRASERSDIVMATRITGRLLELALVLGAVIMVQQSALAIFGGKVVATVLLLAWLLHWMRRNVHVARNSIDLAAFRAGLIYGLPLMANELASSVLYNVDRVLLKHYTGDFAAVGIYAIGFTLAMQISVFLNSTLLEAFNPVANQAYESSGSGAVRALKQRILLPMTYAVAAIVAMVLVTGQDVIVALSGPEKAASGKVFVVIAITVSLSALIGIASYGLLLKKRSMLVLMITIGAAVLSVVLNIILIPRMGYMGAAWAFAICFGAMAVADFVACPKGLLQLPDARTACLAVACAVVLVVVAHATDLFGLHNAWSRLFAAGVLFVLLYVLPVLGLDPNLRRALLALRTRPGIA